MASRKIQVHKVEEPSMHKMEIGMDNPALDNHDTVRSLVELIDNESAMAEEEVPPSPAAATVSSASEPAKTNGTPPCAQQNDIVEEEEEEEEDIEEEARRMGVDAGEIAMIAHQTSIRRMSSSISKISSIKPKKKEYPLKITVGALFVVIVIGVSLIFHFYHQQLHLLKMGAAIKFDEITRHIDVEGENEVLLMRGDLGVLIPSEVRYLDCSTDITRKTHLCLTWKDHAQIWIDYKKHDNVNCYKIAWLGQKYDSVLKDCYEIGDVHWYGGGFLIKDQMWTIDNMSLPETLFVTGNQEQPGQLGPVLARYWLNSNGIAIFAPSDYPLLVSFNEFDQNTKRRNGKFCLSSHNLDTSGAQRIKQYPEMNYTVCVSDDINSVHMYSLNETLFTQNKTTRNPPSERLFKNTVWSTRSLFNFTQESLTEYGKEIVANNYSHGFLILSSKWEEYLGDLTFSTQTFPDSSAMLRNLKSNFTLSLSVTPFIDTRSGAFQHDIHDKLLVEDAGGMVPGLTQYTDPVHNTSIIAGVIKVDSQYFPDKLRNMKNMYGIDSVLLRGGDVRSLPFGADQGSVLVSNANWFTQKYLDAASSTYATVLTESASQAQLSLPIIVMPALANTWDGLRAILPGIFTLGLLGYPFVLPEFIGGSISDPDGSKPDKELFIRWMELSAFLPVMHFSNLPHSYDSTTADISRKFIQFHSAQIAPVVSLLAEQSVSSLEPIVRPMWWIAPQDKKTFPIDDQFMIGDNMLVAPMLENATQRNIYLPEGSWLDKQKNKLYTGPQWLDDYFVGLDEVPYFIWQSQ